MVTCQGVLRFHFPKEFRKQLLKACFFAWNGIHKKTHDKNDFNPG